MLQRMLDLASSRGLQVIVLTCNPADYAALGTHRFLDFKAMAVKVVEAAGVEPAS
jgi:hypothetical protein